MNQELKDIIIRVIQRYFDVQITTSENPLNGDKYSLRLRRSNPNKAYKRVDFVMNPFQKGMSSEEAAYKAIEDNFEELIIGLMEDTDTLHKLNTSFWQRLNFLFTKKLLK